MALGFAESETGSGSGEFLGRIQFDARVGFWKIVKRVKGPDGYVNEDSDPMPSAAFAVDFGTLEVGYSKIASPPVFMLVPFGQPMPPQPSEMQTDEKTGKSSKAFKPSFRVKVASSKTFGDSEAYYFSANSKNVLSAMDTLHDQYMDHPEAAAGKIPVVSSAKSVAVKIAGPQGVTTYYQPDLKIVSWVERPAVFGERLVAAPGQKPQARAAVAASAKPVPAAPVPVMDTVEDDDIPF